jgi:hypothetical protein
VIYVGSSATAATPNSPTYWFSTEQPHSAVSFATDTGELSIATPSGVLAGGIHASASVGTLSSPQAPLPGTFGGESVLDATTDAVYLVTPGSLNYEVVSTSSLTMPSDGLALPDAWRDVEKYSTSYIAFGEYLTQDFGSNVLGIDPVTMQTVFVGQEGDSLVDARTYGAGTVTIVMVQGISGPAIYTSSDGFTTRVELEPAFGVDVAAIPNSMNDQGLGFIANMNGEARAVSFGLTISPVEQVIQVTSRIHEGLYPVGYIGTGRGGRTFETVLYGSSDFDATKISRSTLFVGDSTNTSSARITSVSYRDVNRDGKQDAVLVVDKRTAFSPVADDTTRTLEITGKLTSGTSFDASSAVTVTNQTWSDVWLQTEGPNWFRKFLKRIRLGWWI